MNFSLAESIDLATRLLTDVGIDNAQLDAELILQHVLQKTRLEIFLMRHTLHRPQTLRAFLRLLARRLRHEPFAYIVGHKEFFGRDFIVSRACLIPRPDTEIVVEECLMRIPVDSTDCIVDMCTGSGAIGITILKERRQVSLVATDLSKSALKIAHANAEHHAVLDRITLKQGDMFAALTTDTKARVIVANPPYIPTRDIALLSSSVRDFEPHRALDGDHDGLRFYRDIIANAPRYLAEKGFLIVEIGCDQASAILELVRAPWLVVAVVKDLAAQDRCIVLQLSDGNERSKANLFIMENSHGNADY